MGFSQAFLKKHGPHFVVVLDKHWLLSIFKERYLIVDTEFFGFEVHKKIDTEMLRLCSVDL